MVSSDRLGASPIDIEVYTVPVFPNRISIPVVKRLALDCQRIAGT